MKAFNKIVFYKFCSSWEYKAIILYIFLGMFFTTAQYTNRTYFEIFNYSITNKNFLVVVLYPCFLVMTYKIMHNICSVKEIIIRFNDKITFCKNFIKVNFYMSLFIFIQTIIITLICCNITANNGFEITSNLKYDVLDIYVYIVNIIKIFLTIVTITLLGILLIYKKNKYISIITIILSTLMIFFGEKLYPSGIYILDIFNPGFNSHGYLLTNKIIDLIISGIIYFPTIDTMLLKLIFNENKKSSIGI